MKIYFIPQPDITAFELATIFGNVASMMAPPVHGIDISSETWNRMEPNLQRHWSESSPDEREKRRKALEELAELDADLIYGPKEEK